MTYNCSVIRVLQQVQGDPVRDETLAFTWVISTISKKLTAPLRERYCAISPNLLPPNMGKSFFISSFKAWLLIEYSDMNTCSLTPSQWIMTVEIKGVKKVDCLFHCIRTRGIYQNTVWFSSPTPRLFSLESVYAFLIHWHISLFQHKPIVLNLKK